MRAVLDTNVLMRAFCSPFGPAKELLQLVTAPPHDLVLSPFVIAELHRVIRYDRVRALHQRDDGWINASIADLQSTAILMSPIQASQAGVVTFDPDDDPIVALAVAGHAERLVTLDQHLRSPAVRTYCRQFGIEVCSDVELLAELRGRATP